VILKHLENSPRRTRRVAERREKREERREGARGYVLAFDSLETEPDVDT
jgi:hypothetical protein